MEPQQLSAIETLNYGKVIQVTLLGLWSTRRTPYVPDPFGHGEECFKFVFSLIADAVTNIAGHLHRFEVVASSTRD
jgi:hypothetical protein